MSHQSHDAVLVDFYGTLTAPCQRGPGHARVAEILGCSLAEMEAVLDGSFYTRARGETGGPLPSLRWVAERVGVRVGTRQLRAAQAARIEAIGQDTRLRPDAAATLRRLRRAGLKVALVSDCCWELPRLLPRYPIAYLLDTAIFSVHIGACKPHPTIYLAACAALRVRPERCLYLGDGGSAELTGAQALGMTAVRLAAPDLGGHLTFRSDPGFEGTSVPTLLDFVRLVTAPVPV